MTSIYDRAGGQAFADTLVTCFFGVFTMKLGFGESMGRIFGFVGTVVVLAAGMYIYANQAKSAMSVGGSTTPTGAVNITGVRSDLLSLASAERNYYASNARYASLEDLISEKYVTIQRERPPYSYDISTTSSGFQVTATRSTPGSPAKIWIDETMQVQSGD